MTSFVIPFYCFFWAGGWCHGSDCSWANHMGGLRPPGAYTKVVNPKERTFPILFVADLMNMLGTEPCAHPGHFGQRHVVFHLPALKHATQDVLEFLLHGRIL